MKQQFSRQQLNDQIEAIGYSIQHLEGSGRYKLIHNQSGLLTYTSTTDEALRVATTVEGFYRDGFARESFLK
jgi:hypothetical protein